MKGLSQSNQLNITCTRCNVLHLVVKKYRQIFFIKFYDTKKTRQKIIKDGCFIGVEQGREENRQRNREKIFGSKQFAVAGLVLQFSTLRNLGVQTPPRALGPVSTSFWIRPWRRWSGSTPSSTRSTLFSRQRGHARFFLIPFLWRPRWFDTASFVFRLIYCRTAEEEAARRGARTKARGGAQGALRWYKSRPNLSPCWTRFGRNYENGREGFGRSACSFSLL